MRLTELLLGPRLSKYIKSDEPETKGILKYVFKGECLVFQSPYPPSIAAARLREQIVETPFLFFPVCEDSLIGKVTEKRVRLQWGMQGMRNSFNPIFSGRFESLQSGSELRGTYRLSNIVVLFLCAWFGCLAAGSVVATTIVFAENGLSTFRSTAGIFLLVFIAFAVLFGASGIGLIAFGRRIARDSLLNMSETIKRGLSERQPNQAL